MLKAYGAYGEKTMYGKKTVGVIRSTFVIGADGRIERAYYNVRATGMWPGCARTWPPDRGAAIRDSHDQHRGRSPTAEAQDLGSCEYGFKSHRPHR